MSEGFKAYTNFSVIAANDRDTQIILYYDKPTLDDNGNIQVSREEQGVLILSNSYVKKFADALNETIRKSEEILKMPNGEVNKNESK